MGKGRKFAPNLFKDGDWYKCGDDEAVSILHKREQVKFPIIQKRKQDSSLKEYSFSTHDNRHSLQQEGEYFGMGLGKRIIKERSQHYSNTIHLEDSINLLNQSTYQHHFIRKSVSPCELRRYPRNYPSPFRGVKEKLMTTTTKWWQPNEVISKTKLQALALTQEPHSKPNKWRYSFGPSIFT